MLNSSEYGSKGIVDTEIISRRRRVAIFETSWTGGLSRARETDIEATVNGVTANGDGNTLSINTSTLDLSITVSDGSNTSFDFDITGGGALFQLGPDVVTNQQARLGIQNLNTAKMGGTSGRLYELTSGGDKTLAKDPNAAYAVVSEVISKVATLRGRLGAFQRTTVETNIASLTDTLVNLTDAESAIRDADFAEESSSLTRAQILVQSGTSVLAIANRTRKASCRCCVNSSSRVLIINRRFEQYALEPAAFRACIYQIRACADYGCRAASGRAPLHFR